MPTKNLPGEARYHKILKQIRKEMAQGMIRAREELEYHKLLSYWRIGEMITRGFLDERGRSEMGSNLFERLGADLKMNVRTLQDTAKVYREFPNVPTKDGLTFSHYTMLTRVKNESERNNLKTRIIKEKLTNPQLRLIVKSWVKELPPPKHNQKLPVKRGLLYHYRTREIDDVHPRGGEVEIDCGFDIAIDKPDGLDKKLFRGRIMKSVKENGLYDLIQLKPQPSRDKLYTYVARIERVVDVDTVVVKVDVGFGIRVHQRLRLKGIDGPELSTFDGRQAKSRLVKILGGVDFTVIKTYGTDQYKRYVVDVFYLPGEEDPFKVAVHGRFLNQELLDAGLAVIYNPKK